MANSWSVPQEASEADKKEFVVFALTRRHIKQLIDDARVDKLTDEDMRGMARIVEALRRLAGQ